MPELGIDVTKSVNSGSRSWIDFVCIHIIDQNDSDIDNKSEEDVDSQAVRDNKRSSRAGELEECRCDCGCTSTSATSCFAMRRSRRPEIGGLGKLRKKEKREIMTKKKKLGWHHHHHHHHRADHDDGIHLVFSQLG